MKNLTIILFSFAAVFVFSNRGVFAQTVVVPNALDNVEGSDRALAPFNCGGIPAPTTSMRYQQIYLGSQFSEEGLIDKISLRLNNQSGSGSPGFGPTILPNVLIELSTTQIQPDAINSVFADNVGPDVQTVYSGDLALSAPDCNTQSCPFDVMILLESPFFYNHFNGNLLLDVRIPDCVNLNTNSDIYFDGTDDFPTTISRVSAPDVNAEKAPDTQRPPFVTQFRIIEPPPPAQVPTLSEWGMIAMVGILGIVGFMVIRRKKITA